MHDLQSSPVPTSLALWLSMSLLGACGEPGVTEPSLSARGLEHSERIDLDASVGFETVSGVNGVRAMTMAAGDSTLVTTLVQHRESDSGLDERGALEVRELRSARWVETAFLTHPNADGDRLGLHLATDDRTILASVGGSPGVFGHASSVAVFEKRGGEWTLTQLIEGLGCVAGLAVEGDLAAVADCCPAPGSKEGEVPVGRAHVLRRSEGLWYKAQELNTSLTASTNRMGSRFSGDPIAIDRGTIVMGVPFYTPPGTNLYDSGIAFVFHVGSGTFSERWILEPKYPESGGQFGDSVDIDEGLIAVSALGELGYKGRVYLYSIEAGWKHLTHLTPENTRGLWGFGWSLDLSGSRLLVGAPAERGEHRGINDYAAVDPDGLPYGAAYLFTSRFGDSWEETYYLKDANPNDWGNGFGAAVMLSGDQVLVGGTGSQHPGFIHVWTLTR